MRQITKRLDAIETKVKPKTNGIAVLWRKDGELYKRVPLRQIGDNWIMPEPLTAAELETTKANNAHVVIIGM